MIENLKIKEYKNLESNPNDKYIPQLKRRKKCCTLKKIINCLSIIIILCIFITFFSTKIQFENKIKYFSEIFLKYGRINKNKNLDEMLPLTNLSEKITKNKSKIFDSRRLYIAENNITNEYIRYIRPIDEEEEKIYKEMLFPDLSFENYTIETRDDLISVEEFYKINQKEKLIDKEKYFPSENPMISIILPVYNKKTELLRSLRSIQNQSFKNIEIILIDDCSTDDNTDFLEELFESEPRIRLFKHLKNMGVWRSRMDGFLYSKGKYVLHFDPGDLYADNYVLEDSFDLINKYNLDTVRFSFSKTREGMDLSKNETFAPMKIYPARHTQIIYGRPDYNIYELGYGTIWNKIVRANIFLKGLQLIDEYILNAYKNLWEDMWWNDLIDRISYGNLIVNRLGYIYLYTHQGAGEPKIRTSSLRNKTIKEFILFWFFDYQLLPKNDGKKRIIETLKNYNTDGNNFCRIPMHVCFLKNRFFIYERLLYLLINDPYVSDEDKELVNGLYSKYLNYFNKTVT